MAPVYQLRHHEHVRDAITSKRSLLALALPLGLLVLVALLMHSFGVVPD